MDLEVVGRHALLFDDDVAAGFVNSTDALVDWNSLSIDRYDVRHLLAAPPPPRKSRNRRPDSPALFTDSTPLESELDIERYLDLPPSSPSDKIDIYNDAEPGFAGGYKAVPFSYGGPSESTDQKNTDAESAFRPPFSVPDSLLQNLPPTEKVHQIIARTAIFVGKHGGQSEIVLRVKQGDNPTFGFLMPDHHLHTYFRFLVDHQELLNGKSVEVENKADGGGGALSLLGSVYGSGEDEDGATENAQELENFESKEVVDAGNVTVSGGSEQMESSVNVAEKEEVSKHALSSMNEKAHFIKRNGSISTVKVGTKSETKKGALGSLSAAYTSQTSTLSSSSKVEPSVVEPPSDLKRVVDKIVEFILKNGKQFEAVLVEQDIKHGRFPFLLPSSLYHPYYLKVLQKAEESKLLGKSFTSEKHGGTGLGLDKKSAITKECDALGSDIPYESDRKEKFKMVIGKSRKDGQDPPSKPSRPQVGVSVDAAAAAAILRAATRGVRNPNLEILAKTAFNGTSQGPSSEGGSSVSVPAAKAIAKSVAVTAASEADSSEALLTNEQKLKAERLRRAKIFAAMLRNGAASLETESVRSVSVEPLESGNSVSGAEVMNVVGKQSEESLVSMDVDAEKIGKSEEKVSVDSNERRSKRRYRSMSKRYEEEKEEEGEDNESDEERDHKHSRKEHRSHRSSYHSRNRHKHRKRHSSSKDRDYGHRHKHGSSPDDDHQHPQRQWKHDSTSDDEHGTSSSDEHWQSQNRRKHNISSDDECRHRHDHDKRSDEERRHRSRSSRRKKKYHSEREMELEEGEICSKSDQSKASEGDVASREASVDFSKSYQNKSAPSRPSDTTKVSNDLRAKIRAMLRATL
ncbi:Surp domain-containing protein/DRY_EERY domain-containing protein [Cephalotus follicularis]|uniref:Surp domain-containing protein/DRY_EERY domain-containing protein n=1 Tax=Cephalotus follicularis TaxID=3775 RepID=A0A1Q3CP77_CEPFO|nr:Surp domain-containing protein/DRY_EERY domain-containing protein [Cephalotus follicularis]